MDATGKRPQALGALSKNEMLTIAEPAFKLKLNEVTEPVKTALGWHILKLNRVEDARVAMLEGSPTSNHRRIKKRDCNRRHHPNYRPD